MADHPASDQAKPGVAERIYIRDGAEIYRRSFAMIRAETDLSGFEPHEAGVVVRLIHACGMVEIARQVAMAPSFVEAARTALSAGAPVLCDARMVADGVTRSRLPAGNPVICTLDDTRTSDLARSLQTTRTAAALDLWGDRLAGAVVAIGNAPTALFRLMDLIDAGAAKPAAIIGIPVGFVGAQESKDELAAWNRVPWLIVRGRQGGSAMTAAAVNALASTAE